MWVFRVARLDGLIIDTLRRRPTPKFKMAAAKLEVVIFHVLQQIYTRIQRLYQGFQVVRLNGLIIYTRRHRPNMKRNMATAKPEVAVVKPEVLITQAVYQLQVNFQMLNHE